MFDFIISPSRAIASQRKTRRCDRQGGYYDTDFRVDGDDAGGGLFERLVYRHAAPGTGTHGTRRARAAVPL